MTRWGWASTSLVAVVTALTDPISPEADGEMLTLLMTPPG